MAGDDAVRIVIEFQFHGINGVWKLNRYDDMFGVNVRGFHFRIRPLYFEFLIKG